MDGTRDLLPCTDDGRRSNFVRTGEAGRLASTRCALVSCVKLRSTPRASSPKPKKEKKYYINFSKDLVVERVVRYTSSTAKVSSLSITRILMVSAKSG